MDVEVTDSEDTEQVLEDTRKKTDSVNYVFIVLFYFLGTTCFVPSNFYVSANGYWMYKFRDPYNANSSNTQKTDLQKNFTAYANIAGNVGMIAFMFITFALAKRIALQRRLIGSMVVLLVLFTVTLAFVFIDTDEWQSGFFYVAVGTAGLLNSCSSVLLISTFQLAARFPMRYLAAQLAGQSLCGILAAVVQVFALGVASTVQATAGLFYSIAILVVAGTIVAFVMASNKSEDFRTKLRWQPEVVEETQKFDVAKFKGLLRKLWLLIVSLIMCLMATQMLNPGITALIESSGKGLSTWSDTYFVPVNVFLLFNTLEFVGREASNYFSKFKHKYVIFGTSIVRLALFPLILLCNIQPRNNLPVIFDNDAWFIIFMILLSFSSGYLQNLVIIILPDYCTRDEKTMCMFIIMFIMLVFVTIASILSGVIVNLI